MSDDVPGNRRTRMNPQHARAALLVTGIALSGSALAQGGRYRSAPVWAG